MATTRQVDINAVDKILSQIEELNPDSCNVSMAMGGGLKYKKSKKYFKKQFKKSKKYLMRGGTLFSVDNCLLIISHVLVVTAVSYASCTAIYPLLLQLITLLGLEEILGSTIPVILNSLSATLGSCSQLATLLSNCAKESVPIVGNIVKNLVESAVKCTTAGVAISKTTNVTLGVLNGMLNPSTIIPSIRKFIRSMQGATDSAKQLAEGAVFTGIDLGRSATQAYAEGEEDFITNFRGTVRGIHNRFPVVDISNMFGETGKLYNDIVQIVYNTLKVIVDPSLAVTVGITIAATGVTTSAIGYMIEKIISVCRFEDIVDPDDFSDTQESSQESIKEIKTNLLPILIEKVEPINQANITQIGKSMNDETNAFMDKYLRNLSKFTAQHPPMKRKRAGTEEPPSIIGPMRPSRRESANSRFAPFGRKPPKGGSLFRQNKKRKHSNSKTHKRSPLYRKRKHSNKTKRRSN